MISIEWVDEPVTIRIDMSKLTWGDVVAIQRAQDGGETDVQAVLESIVSKVTGQDAASMPAQAFSTVVQAMMERANGGGEAAKN